jgi:CheY-like chemotaxis protein
MLDKLGYQATVVANGTEVMTALEQQSYDVILMDVQMPGMDGITATQRIRTHCPTDQQPYIIALTAHSTIEDQQRCLDAGMDDYLIKPIRPEHLAAALVRATEFGE